MSKDRKKTAIPRLRFPEFRNAGPWEVKSIEEVSKKITQGGTPKTYVHEYWDGDIPWITPAEMGDDAGHHYVLSTNRTISRLGLENSSVELLPVNSVIISSRAPIGYVAINKVKIATNQGCKGIVPNSGTYFEFLYYSLLISQRRLNDLGAGGGFKEISIATLKTFQIPIPTLPEQKKIADCLSSIDELIELESQKLEALKAHKKGLMQQLFPQEGETVPRLRFPEFRDAGPWKRRPLYSVLEYERPEKYIVDSDNYQSMGIPVLTANKGFILGYTNELHGIYDDVPVIIFDDFTTDKKYVDFPFKIKFSAIKILKAKEENNLKFLYELMGLINFDPEQHKRYYISEYQNIKVYIPKPEEQQKIAECLSSIDELIELGSQKLEALKAHKKGLMQQLFPSEVA